MWAAAALLPLLIPAGPARADCSTSGTPVTCTTSGGTQTTPVGTGIESSFTVNVQTGATVDVSGTSGATAINLYDSNTVTNAGSIISGDGGIGISINNFNQVTNSGSISVGDNATGINANTDNVIFNSGVITVGGTGYGIFATDRNTITNTGQITVGASSYGIFANGDGGSPNATISNSGTITAIGGFGIGALSNYNVKNSGTISVGASGVGIQVDGGNTVTNSGIIQAGNSAIGIQLNGYGTLTSNTVTNSGSILAPNGFAIFGDSNNSITNTGTIQGFTFLSGSNNTLTNSGYLIGGGPNSLASISGAEIEGTLINEPSGTIAVRVSPTSNDVFLAGTISLNGGHLSMIVTPGIYDAVTVYSQATTLASPLQTCGCGAGLSGTFDSISSSSPFFTATADYSTANEVDVTLTRLGFASVPGMTPNERAVGNALEPGYSTGLTGTAATFYGNLLAATSVNVLDHLSGEGTSASQGASFGAGGLFTNAMMQQGLAWLTGTGGGVTATFGGPLGYAGEARAIDKPGYEAFAALRPRPESERWRAWGLGFGAARAISGEASTGSSDQTMLTAGGAFGVDHQIGPDLLLGFAVGASGSTFNVSNLSTSGNVDGGHAGVYAIKTFGTAYAAATFNYARFENSTQRTITGAGPTETATGRFASDQIGGRLEFGWKRNYNGYSVTPFVAIEPSALWQQAYTETSTTAGGAPGVLGLSYQSHVATSLPTFLGAQYDTRYVLASGQTLSPFARLSWVHEFTPQRQIQASFVSVPSPIFTVDGARAARDGLRLDSGVTLKMNVSTSLFANLSSEVSDRTASIAATGGGKMTW